jgi:RNA polymerase sigma factor (sigma-70 family)
MERPGPLFLVDARGIPFPDVIQEVLETLVPRLLRQFSHLDDPVLFVEVLEETGERILRRQRARGTLCKPYGFAWVTARNVALSRLRLSRVKLVQRTLSTDDAAPHLATLQAIEAAPAAIEDGILLREAFAQLSPDERRIFAWKQAGFSSEWIGRRVGKSVAAVNTAFTRAKQRLRRVLDPSNATDVSDVRVEWQHSTEHEAQRDASADVGSATRWLRWSSRVLRPWLVDDDS